MADRIGEHPITQPPARLVKSDVGLASDDAVDGEAASLLELPDRTVARAVENVRVSRRGEQAEDAELGPDLGHGGAAITAPIGLHRTTPQVGSLALSSCIPAARQRTPVPAGFVVPPPDAAGPAQARDRARVPLAARPWVWHPRSA